MILKFVDRFIKKHRYVEVVVLVLIYSLLFIYFWKFTLNNFLGFFVFLIGLVLWIKSLVDIGSSFSALPKAEKLVTTGLYSKFRHPIYYSGILIDIGLVIYTLNFVILIIVSVIFLVQLIRIHNEERILTKKFGKKYLEYKKKTLF